MNLRPVSTTWFELLTTHEELTDTLEALAHTGCIELELHEHTRVEMDLEDLQSRLYEYTRMERDFGALWPSPDPGMSPFSGSPGEILDKALACLRDWEQQALPRIRKLEYVDSHLNHMRLLHGFLAGDGAAELDLRLLTEPGTTVGARLFQMPSKTRLEHVPGTVLWKEYTAGDAHFLLLVGTLADLDGLTAELAIRKHTYVHMPRLPARRDDALRVIVDRQAELEAEHGRLHKELDDLAGPYHLAQALGEIRRMSWFVANVITLPTSENFAWITGWTSDGDGRALRQALGLLSSHAILHFPAAPADLEPPLILANPWWAQPFELFARMLGTPGRDEADPSRILAVMAPLLFGYMFGDVGQGMVLLLAGLLLKKRWPLLRILVVNGASAIMFGFLFGSMFGREDLVPALWLHPIADPLPLLIVPMVAGVLIILTGMVLNALESSWRGEFMRWLHTDAAVGLLYLGILSSLVFDLDAGVLVIAVALTWFLAGSLLLAGGSLLAVLAALAGLVETLLQLVLNTVSFVRVGAFALAHAGLSLAFNIMADSTGSLLAAGLVMLLGNIIVIVLEGLVVSIQTTRLILFEFFIRFLRADGRVFRPLAAPATGIVKT